MKRVVAFLVFMACLAPPPSWGQQGNHSVSNCIGTICIDHQWTDANPFFAQYGEGLACKGKFPMSWYFTQENDWVSIGRYHGNPNPINHIMVSKYALVPCYMPPSPKHSFGALKTEHGVGLGDTRETVLSAYGQPVHEYSDPKSVWRLVPSEWHRHDLGRISILEYYPKDYVVSSDDLPPLVMTVFLENNVVVALALDWPPG